MVLGVLLCGCASINSLRATPHKPQGLSKHPRKVYGGVQDSVEFFKWCRRGPAGALILIPIIDLPFSSVADTVALPFTIPYNLMKVKIITSNQAAQVTAPKVAEPDR